MPDHGCVLITGAARRIGAQICRELHHEGFDIALHYHHSENDAQRLAEDLNNIREGSIRLYRANLQSEEQLAALTTQVLQSEPDLCGLVNNASLYEGQAVEESSSADWQRIINTNLRAPWFLCRELAMQLAQTQGAIVNILDTHSSLNRSGYALYDLSKNGLASLTRSLAREMAPAVRVNGVAPGAILWPENEHKEEANSQDFLAAIPMARLGEPSDIAQAVLFLLDRAPYITGQVLSVDGGRNLAG